MCLWNSKLLHRIVQDYLRDVLKCLVKLSFLYGLDCNLHSRSTLYSLEYQLIGWLAHEIARQWFVLADLLIKALRIQDQQENVLTDFCTLKLKSTFFDFFIFELKRIEHGLFYWFGFSIVKEQKVIYFLLEANKSYSFVSFTESSDRCFVLLLVYISIETSVVGNISWSSSSSYAKKVLLSEANLSK